MHVCNYMPTYRVDAENLFWIHYKRPQSCAQDVRNSLVTSRHDTFDVSSSSSSMSIRAVRQARRSQNAWARHV